MRTVAIIQARMGSTRLPGKVMMPLAGHPIIFHVVERTSRVPSVDEVVVATSIHAGEERLISYLNRTGINVFRGPEDDVLARYFTAAKTFDADAVVRITADCPLISPKVTDRVVRTFQECTDTCDYVSNTLTRTFPRGLDCEVISFEALDRAHREASDASDREHVTPYVRRNSHTFRLVEVADETSNSHLRWTVDEEEDYKLISRIFESLYEQDAYFDYEDVLSFLERHPRLAEINQHVEQKKV